MPPQKENRHVTTPDTQPAEKTTDRTEKLLQNGLSAHILPASATMIGVCMTVLSIGHLGPGSELHMLVDKVLAVDALVFLASALLSFMSMRTQRFANKFEARAELVFITGLGLLALVAVVLAFAIT
ncbi:hypothetical protein D9M73_76100 [compost metagenome]